MARNGFDHLTLYVKLPMFMSLLAALRIIPVYVLAELLHMVMRLNTHAHFDRMP
jgi:hypothetical protein